ncbi:hypothetical protein Bca101_088744 [Brassica carinata]
MRVRQPAWANPRWNVVSDQIRTSRLYRLDVNLSHLQLQPFATSIRQGMDPMDMSNGAPEIETEREQAQINVVSDEKMVQVENSETETQAGVEPKDHLMPPSCPHTLFGNNSHML